MRFQQLSQVRIIYEGIIKDFKGVFNSFFGVKVGEKGSKTGKNRRIPWE